MQSHFCDTPTQVEKPKFNHGETWENPTEGLLPNTGYNLQKCHGYESLSPDWRYLKEYEN